METIKQAVEHYNELLEAGDTLNSSREFISERLNAEKMIFGGRLLSPYLRPHFISATQWNYIKQVCDQIWSCVEIVGKAVTTDKLKLVTELGITPGELELIRIDPGYNGISITSRLDSFFASDAFSFVELNAETPAGVSYAEVMTDIFLELPTMKEFVKNFSVRPLRSRKILLQALLQAYKEWSNGKSTPRIAIVDWDGLPTQCEFEQFKDFFIHSGYECEIVPPEKLEYKNNKLCAGDFEIDLVYRRLLTNDILAHPKETRALIDAYRNHDVCVVNGFKTKLVHKKMFFGILTNEENEHLFNNQQLEIIKKHVPWTRRCGEYKTMRDGKTIDLIEYIRNNREHLVLKPNDEYGGKGIFIGWELNSSEWDDGIKIALTGDYLVQERVKTAHEIFPRFDTDGTINFVEQLVDLDPLLFCGKVEGAFTRLSSTSLCNVSSGSGMVPTFVLDNVN